MQWSVRDVAERLNVSERTVLRWVKHDDLPASRIGGQFRSTARNCWNGLPPIN